MYGEAVASPSSDQEDTHGKGICGKVQYAD
jgi:hypothetical protein